MYPYVYIIILFVITYIILCICNNYVIIYSFSLVLFPRHFKDPATREKTINLIHTFRDYLHYHIKCSKVGVVN